MALGIERIDRAASIERHNEFAIIDVATAGCALVDLKAPLLVCAAFELTCAQVFGRLEERGGVEHFRAYIAEHPKLLPLDS